MDSIVKEENRLKENFLMKVLCEDGNPTEDRVELKDWTVKKETFVEYSEFPVTLIGGYNDNPEKYIEKKEVENMEESCPRKSTDQSEESEHLEECLELNVRFLEESNNPEHCIEMNQRALEKEGNSQEGFMGTCQTLKDIVTAQEEYNAREKEKILKNDGYTEQSTVLFEDKELSNEDMLVCKICYRVFATEYKLESHLRRIHEIVGPNFAKKRGRPRKNPTEEIKQSDQTDWPPNVQRLARRVNGTKMFFCDQCSYRVNRCDSMTKHVLRVHHKGRLLPQFMCEICGKTFVDRAYLRNHGLSHVEDRPFTCEICGRSFHRQPSLRRHAQCHSNDKQFSCLLCDYKTNRKHLMYKHAEHHRTGKSYSCKICNEEFYTQVTLRKHMYVHNTNPNSCSLCRIGFSSKERLWYHMKNVHFACEVKVLDTEESENQNKVNVEYIEVKIEPKA